jgi:flagellar basal body-associated protein FliL|tara:strand:- start:61 stop:168 length:108 start_codon:yes stop_codon:yes gene_type:complete
MDKKDKKFNLKGLLFVIVIVNVFLALAAYVIDLFF